ncbi:MAG TPA: DUF882 domain-containing protein, partial [Accumulibacter sp.]|nr:DUF882 domain-containing protein [Accumulibacter sp.]
PHFSPSLGAGSVTPTTTFIFDRSTGYAMGNSSPPAVTSRSAMPSALTALNNFLRDHYTGEVGAIDPQLFDLLFRTSQELGCREPFQVISGYRCPTTNNSLRLAGGGGVARQSLHMEGKAIDVRLPGVALEDLRDAAISLQVGGVGFYAREQFVHLDTGRIRSW